MKAAAALLTFTTTLADYSGPHDTCFQCACDWQRGNAESVLLLNSPPTGSVTP